jgi:signal transduction histidine kinase
VGKAHQRAAVGSGIGLSIVKSILLAHRAEYGVESEVGKGSKFYFKLKK